MASLVDSLYNGLFIYRRQVEEKISEKNGLLKILGVRFCFRIFLFYTHRFVVKIEYPILIIIFFDFFSTKEGLKKRCYIQNITIKNINSNRNILYDIKPDGLRLSKTVNGVTTTHVWEGKEITLELDGTGVVTNRYIRGTGLIKSDDNGWYLFNGHGDVVQLTDNTGTVTKNYAYDAFGNEKDIDADDTNPFRYSGEYFDKETGTIYLRARYYEPEVGRFLSDDSYTGKAEDPLSLNLYTYCYNNPVNRIDPSGHFAPVVAYLAETAVETAPDILLDMRLEGEDFTLWKSALGNYGANLIPGLGESKKAYKVARIAEKYGPDVLEFIVKHGDNAYKYLDKYGTNGFTDYVSIMTKWNNSDFKHFKDAKQIEKKFGLGKGSYHPSGAGGIKESILSSLRGKGSIYANDISKLGRNPDLAFAPDGTIMVVSTQFKGKSFKTHLNIHDFE